MDLIGYAPGLAAGVFLSRVIGEWIGLPGVWAAVGLSVALGGLGAWLLSRWPLGRTWPALIPLVYILYPEPYPPLAVQAGVVSLIAFGLNWITPRGRTAGWDQLAPLNRRTALPVAGLIAVAFFLLYWLTLAPDVLAADSGELQVVAAQLGVAHPPGFPLYTVLAHLFTRLLPFVSPAYAVNLFSAVTSALTVAVVYLAGAAITRRHLPGLIAALALGAATTFWSQATTANVRSLTALFAALIILALIAFREAVNRGDRRAADSRLVFVALFMGFGLTHHVSLIFLIAIGLLFVVLADPSLLRSPRRWVRPVGAGLLGLLPLLYLPLRAAADVRGASPDLATWSGFWEHTLATGFRGDLFYYVTPADFLQRLRIMGNVMSFQFELIVLLAMIIGLVVLLRRDRSLALLLGGTFLIFTLVAATYRAPQTVEYMMPAYVAAALLVGCAAGGQGEFAGRFDKLVPAVWSLFTALIIVACLNQLANNRAASGAEHEASSARDYAGSLLAEAPADSVILAHWHWATPLWYLQEVEGLRPDVTVQFVFPEGEPYDETWARRTRETFDDGRPVITTWVPAGRIDGLPTPEPLGEALLYPQESRTALPAGFTATDLALGDLSVVGYRLEQPGEAIAAGDELVLTVAWRPSAALDSYGLFAHLVGADGVLYGQDDRSTPAAGGITLTQFQLTPRPGTPLGALSIYLGASGEAQSRELLTAIDSSLSQNASYTRNPTRRAPLNGATDVLIGYDWDNSVADRSRLYLHWRRGEEGYFTQAVDDAATESLELPAYRGPWGAPVREWRFPRGRDGGHYVPLAQGIVWTGETVNGLSLAPGESVVIDQEFHSGRAINRDLVVSVRLIGLEPDDIHWDWWDLRDSIPAMGAIPTLKWVDSSFVRSPHRVTVSETATTGQALTGALTLYDAFTNRPLAILDERITAENPWIALCRGIVE